MSVGDEVERVHQAQGGDHGAFAELVACYERMAYNLALRMVGDREDARDITQAVFLKAYRSLGSFDPGRRFFSWLYRITLNECLNHLRARQSHEPLSERLVDRGKQPEERWEGRQAARIVEEALLELSPQNRQAIVLRHFLELSHQEMSEVMGVPEKTVKSRLFTARRMLAGILRRRGITHP